MTDDFTMGKIDYINASPVYYGLDNGLLPDWITMIEGPPAVLNRMILDRELPLSPVSSAFYGKHHRDLLVLPDLSIACDGPVLSVILMSNCAIEELGDKTVALTEDSATSVDLVKLTLCKSGISPRFISRRLRTLDDVPDSADAALIIGDAALTQPWGNRFRYRTDLGELWHRQTGLPFVFALWVVNRSYARQHPDKIRRVVELFHQSRDKGYENLEKIIRSGAAKLRLPESRISEYYDALYCNLDPPKVQGLETFFSELHEHGLFLERVVLEFV